VGRQQGRHLDQRVEQRAAQPLPAGQRRLAVLEAAGAEPHAYAAYVDGADMVWVSDFGANAVLRFDPATEWFTATYPDGGPNANGHQISGRKGEVFLPESGLDRVMVVRTGTARAPRN
jgi:virginiamycin B lyase